MRVRIRNRPANRRREAARNDRSLPQKAHRSFPAAEGHQRGIGAGKVDPAWASEHASPLVGAAAACRVPAVLFASLVDDPSSDPDAKKLSGETGEQWIGEERQRLHALIEELVKWENSNNSDVIQAARAEIARCVASRKVETGELASNLKLPGGSTVGDLIRNGRADLRPEKRQRWLERRPKPDSVNAFLAEHAPPVLDPFCGGGSIPLEAQRLGLRAYASDLNPVPVLITKALIEIPPKFADRPAVNPEWQSRSDAQKAATVWRGAQGLAEDVRYYGQWMLAEAEKRIGHLYPEVTISAEMANKRPDLRDYVGEKLTVIAWLWARTVASPNPAFSGVHVPLISTYYLCQKTGKEAWVRPKIDKANRTYSFEVHTGTPPPELRQLIVGGTKVARGKLKCILSDDPLPSNYLKSEGRSHRVGHRLLAVVAEGRGQRIYLDPSASCPVEVPSSEFLMELACPEISGYFNPPIYVYTSVGSMFEPRQRCALQTFAHLVDAAHDQCLSDGIDPLDAKAIACYLALAVGRLSNRLTSFCIWDTGRENIAQTFSEQGVPMSWDYVEANPLSGKTGSWDSALEYIPPCIERSPCGDGIVRQADAALSYRGFVDTALVSTDPPYYSSIAYADFADFFYGTLRAGLRRRYPDLFATMTTPKAAEAVAAWHRFNGDRTAAGIDFTNKLRKAVVQICAAEDHDFPVTIYYAFKQQELSSDGEGLVTAWESILSVVIQGGLGVLSTWPIRTEQVSGRKADKNSLASSIVIVGRPRSDDAALATRKQFLAALRKEFPEALRDLQRGNIAPVDLAQAAIGPGMAVFTRYAKVMESDGSAMTVRTALGIINQVVDEVLADQEGEFDPDTRWALAWFEQFGMEQGPFGAAETLSKAKNTAVGGLVEARVIKAKGGKVQLLGRAELPDNWDPRTDRRLTVWETTQHLIRTLEQSGETGAAKLLNKLGGTGETARELAYRLYAICERKKWADEALAYNGLVIDWPELSKLALTERSRGDSVTQQQLF
jgi:putative DNA methylase